MDLKFIRISRENYANSQQKRAQFKEILKLE